MFEKIAQAGRLVGQAARLMVGVPDYATYVAHMQANHPDRPVMSEVEFFRDRQTARYAPGRARSCC